MSIKVNETAKIFKALSDGNRLAIVLSLIDGEKSASEILSKTVPFAQPTLSHHLSILCESEIIKSRRDGKSVIYSINKAAAQKIMDVIAFLLTAKEGEAPKKKTAQSVKLPQEKKQEKEPEPIVEPVTEEPKEEELPRQRVFDLFD